MEQAVVKKEDPILALLGSYKKTIATVLPAHLTPEKALRIAANVIFRNPKLRNCTPISLINGVIEGSIRGLEFGRTCHLIPFGREAVFDADYKGIIELGYRSGKIKVWRAKAIFSNDEFDYEENEWLKHKRKLGEDRGELIGAYSFVILDDLVKDFLVIDKYEAMAAKAKSAGAKSPDSPWNTDQEWQMWAKTAVRLHAKTLPSSPDLQRVAHLSDLAAAGLRQDISHVTDDVIEMREVSPPKEEPSEDPKAAINAKLDELKAGKQTEPEEITSNEGIVSEFICGDCGFQAKTERGLKKHQTQSHKPEPPKPPSTDGTRTPDEAFREAKDILADEQTLIQILTSHACKSENDFYNLRDFVKWIVIADIKQAIDKRDNP